MEGIGGYWRVLDYWILDRIIGLDYWMVFFHPNSDVSRPAGAFLAVFFFCLRHILKNGYKLSKNVISGADFLKNDDIWSAHTARAAGKARHRK